MPEVPPRADGSDAGQKIAIRVAVQRKSGVSAFSEALNATVR